MRSAWTLIIAAATIAVFSNAAIAQQMLKHELPNGGMRNGEVVYVDNGKCPKGQVQKVTGSTTAVETKPAAAALLARGNVYRPRSSGEGSSL